MLKVNSISDLKRPIAHKGGKGTADKNDKEDKKNILNKR